MTRRPHRYSVGISYARKVLLTMRSSIRTFMTGRRPARWTAVSVIVGPVRRTKNAFLSTCVVGEWRRISPFLPKLERGEKASAGGREKMEAAGKAPSLTGLPNFG
ncbi:hypothetical protein Arub01_54180 [Actinomadura rubrobrunea]|uniref:Uncharacterized protein n=1 Tax=Actinomadura rubrobrunea TaxID=115335 RepID=A0A9W6UZV2_9ACTN|nr:hypothetical protein Arub01_54180 [Actinomadura rubrobrunea]